MTARSRKSINLAKVKSRMARHKEFDRDETLHKAMEVFWSQGYEATSIEDLVALDRYSEAEVRRIFELLERPGSVKKSLRHLFEGTVEKALCDEHRRGCFMGNSTSELAGRCKDTAARTRSNMESMQEALYRALLRGKKEGELKGVRDPRAVARFLYSSIQGVLLMAKATHDRKTLNDVVKVTLSVLD